MSTSRITTCYDYYFHCDCNTAGVGIVGDDAASRDSILIPYYYCYCYCYWCWYYRRR